MFVSSNIALTNRVEQISLMFYNQSITNKIFGERCKVVKAVFGFVESQIFSRIAGSLISIAAAIELGFHLVILPFTAIFAIGQSIYRNKADFTLPLQHLQRMRDAVFPLLFGSLFGIIHPYLGTYAAEPAKKHIATGILLSGTNKDRFDAVCSPLTTISEVTSLADNLTIEEKKMLADVYFWESQFEKTQSIDFFNLSLTYKIGQVISKKIDDTSLHPIVKELAKRLSVLTYPIFIVLDLVALTAVTVISLGSLVVKLVGGQSPAYLEEAGSVEVTLYNLVKIPLFLISATVGMAVSFAHPKTGLACMQKPMDWMTQLSFKAKMLAVHSRIARLNDGEYMILPAVETYSAEERGDYPFLPSYGSHMRYLLIEKTDTGFQAEMIERGTLHKKTRILTSAEVAKMTEKTLGLRYNFSSETSEVFKRYTNNDSVIGLGTQTGINNCIVTNLFAAIQVMRHKNGHENFDSMCQQLKQKSAKRYYLYAHDFYPFGETKEVIGEINNRFKEIV